MRSAKCLLTKLSNFFVFIVFVFLQKFSNFSSNLFEKWFENGQRLHLSIELFKSYFVDDIVLYKTMFIHVSSYGEFSHFYRFSKKKFQFFFSPSNFFSIFKNQTNNTKFLFYTRKIFNLLYKIETNKSKKLTQHFYKTQFLITPISNSSHNQTESLGFLSEDLIKEFFTRSNGPSFSWRESDFWRLGVVGCCCCCCFCNQACTGL